MTIIKIVKIEKDQICVPSPWQSIVSKLIGIIPEKKWHIKITMEVDGFSHKDHLLGTVWKIKEDENEWILIASYGCIMELTNASPVIDCFIGKEIHKIR